MTAFFRRPLVLLALIAGFTAMGVLLLLTGNASQRQGGLGIVLFFGVGGLPFAIGTLRRRPEPAIRRLVTLPDGTSVEALRIPRARIPRPFAVIGGIGLAAGCLVFLLSERSGRFGTPVITALLAVMAVVFAAVAVTSSVRRPGPDDGTWFTVRGLLERGSGSVGFVPWRAVDRIALAYSGGQPTMRLHLRDESGVVWRNVIPLLDRFGRAVFGRSTYSVMLERDGGPEGDHRPDHEARRAGVERRIRQ